ncbi:MAG TPA: DUF4124 domain-containing protein [Burkholderiaceae bacterium]|nr:DUF4124 domain-containing protein [Burkholderiaceae bacterium]
MRVLIGAAALLAAASALAEQSVYRCEGKDGRVTYSDEACPTASRSARKLDDAPPLTIPSSKDGVRSAREAGVIAQGRTNARFDPYLEDRRLDEQIETQKLACQDLGRRLNYYYRDVEAARESERASAELALRRAQAEYRTMCVRR